MSPPVRKLALAAHLCTSVGWIGAAVAYAPLVAAVLSSGDQRVVRGSILLMTSIDRFVILPLAYVALLTGLVISLATPWGLFRHWWVLFSLLLTVAAVFVLTEYSLALGRMAALAAGSGPLTPAELAMLKDPGHAVHDLGGIGVLLVVAVLNVYKPQGLTRHGWTKQEERRSAAAERRRRQPALARR